MKKLLFLSLFTLFTTITFDTTCMLTRPAQQGSFRGRFTMLRKNYCNTALLRALTKKDLIRKNKELGLIVDLQQEEIELLEDKVAMLEKKNHPHSTHREWYNTRYENRGHHNKR